MNSPALNHRMPQRWRPLAVAVAPPPALASSGTTGGGSSVVPHPQPLATARRHGGPARDPAARASGRGRDAVPRGSRACPAVPPHQPREDTTHGVGQRPTITTQHHQTQRLEPTPSSGHPTRRRAMPRVWRTRSRPSRPRHTRIPRRNTRPNESPSNSRFTLRRQKERKRSITSTLETPGETRTRTPSRVIMVSEL